MRRQIVGSPFDSDSEVSFSGGRKAGIMKQSFLDKISNDALELQGYGVRLANHAIDAFLASDGEKGDGDFIDESGSRIRRARKKATKLASSGAASLQKVADDVLSLNPCLGPCQDEDEFSSSAEKRRPRRKPRRKKKVSRASQARPHDGDLSGSISVTTDDDSSASSESSWSESTTESVARLNKLRRRRQQFLRRRALERAAGADTEDEDEESVHFGGPRLGSKKSFPSQELRKPLVDVLKSADGSINEPQKVAAVPELVNTSNEESFLNTTNEEDPPNDATNAAEGAVDLSLGVEPNELTWQHVERTIPELSSNLGLTFLANHHLGALVVLPPNESLRDAGLQLGDVIIRLNQQDVSNMDAADVSDTIEGMTGDCVSITYLRKNMLL